MPMNNLDKQQSCPMTHLPHLISLIGFCHNFQVLRIFMIEYAFEEVEFEVFSIPVLGRRYNIKWWAKTNLDNRDNGVVNKLNFCYNIHP